MSVLFAPFEGLVKGAGLALKVLCSQSVANSRDVFLKNSVRSYFDQNNCNFRHFDSIIKALLSLNSTFSALMSIFLAIN